MGLTRDGVIVAEPTGTVEQLEGETHTQPAGNDPSGAVEYDPQTEFTQKALSSADVDKNVPQVDGETYRSSWADIAEAKVVKADAKAEPSSKARASTKRK